MSKNAKSDLTIEPTFYDVIICGDGLFALWSSIFLGRHGVKVLRLHESKRGLARSFPGLGVFWGTLPDPPTRAETAHGQETAIEILRFLSEGAKTSVQVLEKEIGFTPRNLPTYRIATEIHEGRELERASQSFSYLREVLDKVTPSSQHIWEELSSFDIGASSFDHSLILDELVAGLLSLEPEEHRQCAKVIAIEESGAKVCVRSQSGYSYESEFVVCGLGASTGLVFPRLRDIVIPVSDSMSQIFVRGSWQASPFVFRASSGHVSGSVRPSDDGINVAISGPRFLLKNAGVGLYKPEHLDVLGHSLAGPQWNSIIGRYAKALHSIMTVVAGEERVGFPVFQDALALALRASSSSIVVTDSWPCDELPLLGEFGTSGRVLGSAGWLGCGHSVALLAAKVISETILHGQPQTHVPPSILSPRRFWIS